MAGIRPLSLRHSLRAISQPSTSHSLRLGGVRTIRTEETGGSGEGMGGSGTKSIIPMIAASVVAIGGAFYLMLGPPEKTAGVVQKVDSVSAEIKQR